MPKSNRYYKQLRFGKSVLDNSPTLIINRYHVPNSYFNAVKDVITAYKNDIPFNKALDQVAALYPNTINRNKLAEHTLKYIANDYWPLITATTLEISTFYQFSKMTLLWEGDTEFEHLFFFFAISCTPLHKDAVQKCHKITDFERFILPHHQSTKSNKKVR